VSSFESEIYLLTPGGTSKLGLPLKASLDGFVDDQLIVTLKEDWTPEGGSKAFAAGSVLSLDAEEVKKDSAHLKPTVVFAPSAQEFVQEGAGVTKNHLLLTTLDHVQGAPMCTRIRATARGRTASCPYLTTHPSIW